MSMSLSLLCLCSPGQAKHPAPVPPHSSGNRPVQRGFWHQQPDAVRHTGYPRPAQDPPGPSVLRAEAGGSATHPAWPGLDPPWLRQGLHTASKWAVLVGCHLPPSLGGNCITSAQAAVIIPDFKYFSLYNDGRYFVSHKKIQSTSDPSACLVPHIFLSVTPIRLYPPSPPCQCRAFLRLKNRKAKEKLEKLSR